MTLKDADKIKEAIKNSDDFVGGSDDIIKVIDSVPEVVINTDTDTISRKAAIDIISQHTFYNDYDDTDKCSLLDELSALPSAQPERIRGHWIPVTEATPTEDDDYWATFEAETGRFVDWASWYQGRWVVWIEGSPAHLSNVIAWCYPIEPYKGGVTT